MGEKVYGICGTNKCKKEVIPKEESYTKTEINDMTVSKWESYPTIVSNLKSTFNESIDDLRMKFIGDIPIMVIEFVTGGYSFNSRQASFTIPWTSAIQQFKQYIIDNIKRYNASWTGYGNMGLPFSMHMNMYPESDGLFVSLYHDGHGESGWYQYAPANVPLVFVFGAEHN